MKLHGTGIGSYGGQKISGFKKYLPPVPTAGSVRLCDADMFNGWDLGRNN